jgi:hypothetical protein
MYGALTSSDGSNNSWAVNNMSEHMPAVMHAAAQAAADRAAVANLLLQQQRQAAMAGMPGSGPAAVQRFNSLSADGSVAAYMGAPTASQPDLQHMLESLNTQNYLAGLASVDVGAGSMSGTPPLHGLSGAGCLNTAGAYNTLQAAARAGSPAASSGNLLVDHKCQYTAPGMTTAAAAAAAAAANMVAAGSTSSSVAGGYGCVSAPLPRIATRSSDGYGSGVFSMCGQDLSPMTASSTPTFFQQAYNSTVSTGGHSLLGLNATGMGPAAYGSTHLMAAANGASSAAAALQDQLAGAAAAGIMAAAQRVASQSRMATAVRRSSSGLAPYIVASDLLSNGSMGNLLTGENRWGSM